jgi:hypothetical protein
MAVPAPFRTANLPNTARATLPANYAAAKTALATCHRLDEYQDWADKMKALGSYAKQADDKSLHDLALRIHARAVRGHTHHPRLGISGSLRGNTGVTTCRLFGGNPVQRDVA